MNTTDDNSANIVAEKHSGLPITLEEFILGDTRSIFNGRNSRSSYTSSVSNDSDFEVSVPSPGSVDVYSNPNFQWFLSNQLDTWCEMPIFRKILSTKSSIHLTFLLTSFAEQPPHDLEIAFLVWNLIHADSTCTEHFYNMYCICQAMVTVKM